MSLRAYCASTRRAIRFILAGDQRVRGGKPVALDLLVDGGVLLDVGIGLRDVRLGLVVVVVGDEVLHRVLGEELLQFREELRGERLVVRQDERGAVPLRDEVRHREGLAGARHALQDKAPFAGLQPLQQLRHRLRLVARRLERRLQFEQPFAHRPSAALSAATISAYSLSASVVRFGFISNVPPHSKPSVYFGTRWKCRWHPVSPYAP